VVRRRLQTATLVSIFLTLVFTISSVSANPAPPVNSIPETTFPSVTFSSPSPNQIYKSSEIKLTFEVSGIVSGDFVQYYLDHVIMGHFYGSGTVSEKLVGLSEGEHEVQVKVTYRGLYYEKVNGISYPSTKVAEQLESVSFTVVASLPSPSPTPLPVQSWGPSQTSTPSPVPTPTVTPTTEPTIEPISTPKQQNGFLGTNLPTEYGYAIVTVSVAVAAAGLSLIYFKKLRK
jgi:hypothetical protein